MCTLQQVTLVMTVRGGYVGCGRLMPRLILCGGVWRYYEGQWHYDNDNLLRNKMKKATLTLKWSRYSTLPLVVKLGSLWTLTQKSTLPNEFGREMRATDKVIKKNQNTAKKKKKKKKKNRKSDIQLQNGGQKPISISRHKISDQKWGNHFPRRTFSLKFGS